VSEISTIQILFPTIFEKDEPARCSTIATSPESISSRPPLQGPLQGPIKNVSLTWPSSGSSTTVPLQQNSAAASTKAEWSVLGVGRGPCSRRSSGGQLTLLECLQDLLVVIRLLQTLWNTQGKVSSPKQRP
jgi:hypothetical protein